MPEMQHGYGCVAEAFKDGASKTLAYSARRAEYKKAP